MASKAVKLQFAKEQNFECARCPARCCQLPWSIRLSQEDSDRYLGDDWVRERAGEGGRDVIHRLAVLPMRERNKRLACVFLDDDDLCSLQKRFGHEYLPRSCQVFPFGFVQNEKAGLTVQMSHLCPSIRDNYGSPVEKQLPAKLEQGGSDERMTKAMATLEGVIISQKQYLQLTSYWEDELAKSNNPADTIARLFGITRSVEIAVKGEKRAQDAAFEAAFAQAKDKEHVALVPSAKPTLHARVLFAHLLGNLSYPSRVLQSHRVGPVSFWLRARGWLSKLGWMLESGSADLLFIERPVPLARVRRVERFLRGELAEEINRYLALVLGRRHIFSEPRHLLAVLVDLGLATATISRFARCRAASEDRTTVNTDDVREGIAVAELVLLSHAMLTSPSVLMKNLRLLMLSDPMRFRGILASEA